METQNTPALDACLTDVHMRLEELWPNSRERANIDKYARYLSEQDYYSASHLRDLNNYYKREPQNRIAERLSRFLVIALWNIGTHHSDAVRNRIDEWVMDERTYDKILGMEGLQGLELQSHVWKKVVSMLRRFVEDVHDGELHLAMEEDFIKNIEAWFRRKRAAFYEAKKAKMDILRQDLISAAYHPNRVEKWLEAGGFTLLGVMFNQDEITD